jgi:hypothetical protein
VNSITLKHFLVEVAANIQAKEPDTLNYEFFVSADEKTFQGYERYVNSAAILTHFENTSSGMGPLLPMVEITSVIVYGNPNDEAREAFAGFGATFMTPIGGFAR